MELARILTEKRYLGDGVYVRSAGYGTAIWLTTENGISETNRIMLAPEVDRALRRYMAELEAAVRAHFAQQDDQPVAVPQADGDSRP